MFVDGNMFVVGMTYQWKNERARKAFATSVANDAIADFIGDRTFKVIAFEKIASDIEYVSAIEIDGKHTPVEMLMMYGNTRTTGFCNQKNVILKWCRQN